jgi:protein tyrosine phosphatase (PTP) superfamily phosphohydrolase (DUF442 family)
MRRALILLSVVALGLAGVIAAVNIGIALAVPAARFLVPVSPLERVPGVTHLRAVDDRLWRGDAPDAESYPELAARGIITVVDLRAEGGAEDPLRDGAAAAGLRVVHIPIRDGQIPSPAQVDRFLAVVRESPGRVYVHCNAGVGRTGTMSAAYLVQVMGADPRAALLRNISVGPPSLEQLWYAGTFEPGTASRPPAVVSALSRVLDGPRRMWARLR